MLPLRCWILGSRTDTGERKAFSSAADVAKHPRWQPNASLRLRCCPLHPPACCHRHRVAAAQTRQTGGYSFVSCCLEWSVGHRAFWGKIGKIFTILGLECDVIYLIFVAGGASLIMKDEEDELVCC